MHAAQDYVAVDSGDRIVFGPTTDYREAKLHADRVGGVVKFAVAAAEEVKNAKFERCVQHVKRESPDANPWAVCHSVLGEANESNARIHWTKEGSGWFGQPLGYGPRGSQWFFKIMIDDQIRLQVFDGAESTEEPIKVMFVPSVEQAKIRAEQELRSGVRNRSDANEAGHHCSVDSMTQVAQQIPGGPWKHEGTYPPGAKARVDHQKEHSVTVDGASKTITVRYCGSHIILTCPRSGQQHLFQKTCIADTPPGKPQRGKIPAAPGIEPERGKPFVLRVRKGRAMTTEKGPFALITDAVDAMQSIGARGETATIYDGSKVAMYRGGRAVFSFGRTRWSRA